MMNNNSYLYLTALQKRIFHPDKPGEEHENGGYLFWYLCDGCETSKLMDSKKIGS